MNELVTQHELASDIGETTPVSWTAPTEMSFEQWASIGATLQQLGRSLNWWTGDWLNQGEDRFGEKYAQALEMTGMAQETLSKYKSVAARLPAEVRRPDLSWTAHFAVAYGPEHLRGPLLDLAARFELHSRDLKDIMRLKAPQLEELIDACADDAMTHATFRLALNQIRMSAAAQSMIRGEPVTDMPEYEQATMSGERMAPAPRQQEASENEVYIEDIFDYFENAGVGIKRVTASDAAWDGISVRAAIDTNGKPFLHWEKTDNA